MEEKRFSVLKLKIQNLLYLGYDSKYFNFFFFVLLLLLPIVYYFNLIVSDFLPIALNGDGMPFFNSKMFHKEAILAGEWPLWNKYIGGGKPFTDFYPAYTPIHLLLLFLPFNIYTWIYYTIHLSIGAFFTYLYLKEIGCNKISAITVALIYLFSIHLGARKEHIAVIVSITYLPVILYFIEKFFRTQNLKFLLLISFSMAAQVYSSSHIQLIMYTDITAFLYFIILSFNFHCPVHKTIKNLSIMSLFFLSLIAFYLAPLLQIFFEYKNDVALGKDTEMLNFFSIHFSKLILTIFPNFWNSQHHGGPFLSSEFDQELFVGSLGAPLIIFAAIKLHKNFYVRISLLAILLSFLYSGHLHFPYMTDIIKNIPFLNSMRAPTRLLFIFIFFSHVIFAISLSKMKDKKISLSFCNFLKYFIFGLVLFSLLLSVFKFNPDSIQQIGFPWKILLPLFIFILLFAIFAKGKNIYPLICLFAAIITIYQTYPYTSITRSAKLSDFHEYNERTSAIKKEIGNYKTFFASETHIPFYNDPLISEEKNAPNYIMSLHAYSAYSNPRIYKLLNISPINPKLNFTEMLMFFPNSRLLLYQNGIISMLGVKYIIDYTETLNSKHENQSETIDKNAVIFSLRNLTVSPNKEIFTPINSPVILKPFTSYLISFDISSEAPPKLFYFDLYSFGKMDEERHHLPFYIKRGENRYSGVMYTGDLSPSLGDNIYFRLIVQAEYPFNINNLELGELQMSDNIYYKEDSLLNGYPLYINTNAKNILYSPEKIINIQDSDIYSHPNNYNFLTTSYVKYFKDMDLSNIKTEITEINFRTNNITADVFSDYPTFISFSQNYFNGWKAKINGKKTPVYMVNEVIMGIEVPAGDNEIEFYYQPIPVYIAALISLTSLMIFIYAIFLKKFCYSCRKR
jgi:hypothetical protein